MRVLFIANDFPTPAQPGKGPFNRALMQAMAREHELRIIAPVPWTQRRGNRSSAPVFAGLSVSHPTYFFPPRVMRGSYGWWHYQSIRGAVNVVLRDFQPDAVLAYWLHPDGESAMRIAQRIGVPFGVIVGGSDLLLITEHASRRRKIERILRQADAVITVNRHLSEKAVAAGADARKVHTWSQGVDADHFHLGPQSAARAALSLDPKHRIALWVGRMVPVKGLDLLIDAFAITAKNLPDARLVLVGDGPLRAAVESQASALGIQDKIIFAGPKTPDRLGDWYRAADVTVMSSRSEGLPNVLRESLACGTPFVSTNVGGIAEIAGNGANQLVRPGDSDALGRALVAALGQPQKLDATFAQPAWRQSADAIVKILAACRAPAAEPMMPSTLEAVAP